MLLKYIYQHYLLLPAASNTYESFAQAKSQFPFLNQASHQKTVLFSSFATTTSNLQVYILQRTQHSFLVIFMFLWSRSDFTSTAIHKHVSFPKCCSFYLREYVYFAPMKTIKSYHRDVTLR
jgi:hypothetical protein